MTKVLVVDDDPGMVALVQALLRKRSIETRTASEGAEALDLLTREDVDVVLTDLNMRGVNGVELCERVVSNRPDVPVLVMTAFGSLETAIAAIRAGAYDFITKPIENEVLVLAVQRAAQHRLLGQEVRRLRSQVESAARPEGMAGESPAMRKVFDLLDRVGDSDASVLLTGESGTGKELVARAIHQKSKRRDGPFVAINCASMPEALLESELFGHAAGAFSDSRIARRGLFLQADGGTLLLDEVGELPLTLQTKLLRTLQDRAVRPVGGDAEHNFDVHLVSTTNRDLETAIEERRFREDLYYRLNVLHLALPPLRARGSDVLLLAQQFLERFAAQAGKAVKGLSPETARRLVGYSWPGNVRELQNAMERAVALARFQELTPDDLPEKVQNYSRSHVLVASDDPSELVPMEEVERRYILRVMEAVGGNKTLAAHTLGLDRKTLYRKLERYGTG